MGTETRNPLQVTTVSNVANGDYIDITLSSGQRAKCLKSLLLPVVSPSENGFLPKEYAPVYFDGAGDNFSGTLRIAKFSSTNRLIAHLTISAIVSISAILVIDIYTHPQSSRGLKVKNINGEALPSWAKLLYRIDNVNKEIELVLQMTNAPYPQVGLNPIIRRGIAAAYMTITTDDVSTYQPVTIL